MKLKLAIALLVGMVVGALAYHTWDAITATSRHWKAVRKYSSHMRDPRNYKPDGNGLTMASEPVDPAPHLAALVSAGELIHDDIVFPSIPYPNSAFSKHWMAFCERHPDEIVFAYGECEPGPNHLKFWFTEAGRPLIEQLVAELKTIAPEEEPTSH